MNFGEKYEKLCLSDSVGANLCVRPFFKPPKSPLTGGLDGKIFFYKKYLMASRYSGAK